MRKSNLQLQTLVDRNTTHGLSLGPDGKKTRLYNLWVRMRQRCNNTGSSDFNRYGGRGITVCPEWDDFANFHAWSMANGYSDSMSIDRINNSEGYSPDNCRWATAIEQARNKRNNHMVTFNGQTLTLQEWSDKTGIDSSLLRYRLKHWSVERALTTPPRGGQ